MAFLVKDQKKELNKMKQVLVNNPIDFPENLIEFTILFVWKETRVLRQHDSQRTEIVVRSTIFNLSTTTSQATSLIGQINRVLNGQQRFFELNDGRHETFKFTPCLVDGQLWLHTPNDHKLKRTDESEVDGRAYMAISLEDLKEELLSVHNKGMSVDIFETALS